MTRSFYKQSLYNVKLPDLTAIQTSSYQKFMEQGLRDLLDEISPVEDFTGDNYSLSFEDYRLGRPKIDELTARMRNLTYKAPLYVNTTLVNKIAKKTKKSEIYLGDFPLMTDRGTFIINGVERVVVAQIIRSYGVIFNVQDAGDRKLFGAKIIPARGAWLELETSTRDIISVKIDRKRKIPITTFLKAIGKLSDHDLMTMFADVDTDINHKFVESTLARDSAKTYEDALVEVYKRIRPGDLVTPESAESFLHNLFFNPKRYDLGKVGRYKINSRLNMERPLKKPEDRVLLLEDVVEIVREIIRLNNDPLAEPDDIDHLKNRRVRGVGELIQNRLRVGLLRTERIIKDRMSLADPATITPSSLVNNRPIIAVIQEFFASSQLSQFMNQTNPLAELEHKRTINATGPGGLSRERAGFEVRDVHPSYYGRICPIESPEGPNIGLVNYLATYGKINEYGFIETPYFKVVKQGQKYVVTKEIVYLDAAQEDEVVIAPTSASVDDQGVLQDKILIARHKGKLALIPVSEIQYQAVSPKQIVSVSTALIPFVEHDDAKRALMGSNMQRQAVPTVRPAAPIIGTGIEEDAARSSGALVVTQNPGTVVFVDANEIVIERKEGKQKVRDRYHLQKFVRSNQATAINQKPIVNVGDIVKKGTILADGPATQNGELALGQNVLVAFMSFRGLNYEDSIVISERLVREDIFSSIHIEKYEIDVHETKLGPELITRDIPNVGEAALTNLDDEGIVRLGAEVSAGDILVGKITPKGETELTAEEKLLRAIFGENAKDVKDTSLRLPHGERGKVVDIKIFSKDAGDELVTGVYKRVEVMIAQFRRIAVGDKLAGRHGNKGVVAAILPDAEMPYLPDGTPIDIILNPLGVISRMNLGQVLETHLGWAAAAMGKKIASPVFEGVPMNTISQELKKAGLPSDGKIQLYDGQTGEPFDHKTAVGYNYILKLIHLVEDKMHARSTGPYSMVTQQPLGGKAQFGGQRFGEMEVWALQAYGAAHCLQEMLTIKSDDVVGRAKTYEALINGEDIQKPSLPASFNVLVRELQSLSLDIELVTPKGNIDLGQKEKNRRVSAKNDETADNNTEEQEDREVTEILAGQEENPHQASPDEIVGDDD